MPVMIFDLMKSEKLCNLSRVTSCWKVYFIGKNEDSSVFKVIMIQEVEELHLGEQKILGTGFSCIDNIDHCFSIFIIGIPCTPEALLTSQVPYLQSHVLMRHFLYI
jgi:hypothetical protein